MDDLEEGLTRGDVAALDNLARDQVLAELLEFSRISKGRDPLICRAIGAGLSENETARLTGLSRTTVRNVLGKEPQP